MRTETPVAYSNPPPSSLPPHQLCSDWSPHRIQLRSCWEGKKHHSKYIWGVRVRVRVRKQKTNVNLRCLTTNPMRYDGGVHVSSCSIMSVCYHLKALKLCTAVLPLSVKAPHICCWEAWTKRHPRYPLSSRLCVTLCRNMGSAPLTNPSWLQPIIHQSRRAVVGGTRRQC